MGRMFSACRPLGPCSVELDALVLFERAVAARGMAV